MNGRTHLIFGILTAGTLVLTKTEMPEASDAIFVAGSALGSLLPDIDTTKSTIGTILFPISFFVEKLGHRTYTHDIVLWSFISVFILMRYPMLSGVVFGYMGHLFLDSFTNTGIPWLYFFHRKKARELDRRHIYSNRTFGEGYIHLTPKGLRVKSSSIGAKVITVILVIMFAAGIYYCRKWGMMV